MAKRRSRGYLAESVRKEWLYFCEKVLWMPVGDQDADIVDQDVHTRNARFKDGFYVGPVDGHHQSWILTSDGAFRSRNFRRLSEAERWDCSILDMKATVLEPNTVDPLSHYRIPGNTTDGGGCTP